MSIDMSSICLWRWCDLGRRGMVRFDQWRSILEKRRCLPALFEDSIWLTVSISSSVSVASPVLTFDHPVVGIFGIQSLLGQDTSRLKSHGTSGINILLNLSREKNVLALGCAAKAVVRQCVLGIAPSVDSANDGVDRVVRRGRNGSSVAAQVASIRVSRYEGNCILSVSTVPGSSAPFGPDSLDIVSDPVPMIL